MIYLDSAATTLQKPRAVGEAMMAAMRTAGKRRSELRRIHSAVAVRTGDLIFFSCRLADLTATRFERVVRISAKIQECHSAHRPSINLKS